MKPDRWKFPNPKVGEHVVIGSDPERYYATIDHVTQKRFRAGRFTVDRISGVAIGLRYRPPVRLATAEEWAAHEAERARKAASRRKLEEERLAREADPRWQLVQFIGSVDTWNGWERLSTTQLETIKGWLTDTQDV